MQKFVDNNEELKKLIAEWEVRLEALPEDVISNRRNSQNRTIRQITGHLVDSASNNIHRLVHFQYQPNPMSFPDYANLGNNDRWIAIQDYQTENWHNLVQLWKYINLHIIHVIGQVDDAKLNHIWITATNHEVSMKDMILDYLRHFKLHLSEIEELINT